MYTCILCTYIPKYNNLSTYNVTCVYVFSTEHIYVCVYTIYTFMRHMYIYISKYHLLGAYNITCMYVRAQCWPCCTGQPNAVLFHTEDHLSRSQFVFFQLFIVLCVRLSKALLAFLLMFGMLMCHSFSAHIWVAMLIRLCGGRLGCYQEA